MSFDLRKIEISGDPATADMVDLPVRLTYADAADLDDATQWLQVQLKSPAAYGRVLAEVEKDALTLLKRLIDRRIGELQSLQGHR